MLGSTSSERVDQAEEREDVLRERVAEPVLCHVDDCVQFTDAERLLCSTEHTRPERTGRCRGADSSGEFTRRLYDRLRYVSATVS